MAKTRIDRNSVAAAKAAFAQLDVVIKWPEAFGKLDDKAKQKRAEDIFAGIVDERQPIDWSAPDLLLAAELSIHLMNAADAALLLTNTGQLVKGPNGPKVNPIYRAVEAHRAAISRLMRDLQINIRSHGDSRTVRDQAKAFHEARDAMNQASDSIARF